MLSELGTLAFAVSVLWVLYWLIDGLVRLWDGFGKSYRTALSQVEPVPVSPLRASIAFAGEVQ